MNKQTYLELVTKELNHFGVIAGITQRFLSLQIKFRYCEKAKSFWNKPESFQPSKASQTFQYFEK